MSNSCRSCNNVSDGRRLKNFLQCTQSKKGVDGKDITEKKCIPVLVNDANKYKFNPDQIPFRVQFPDEDSCKRAILLPGVGIDCDDARKRLDASKQYQNGEIKDCFSCEPQNHMLLKRCRENPNSQECQGLNYRTVENYGNCNKKDTYLSLENCWKNQDSFQL
jgi:hypothetical protein